MQIYPLIRNTLTFRLPHFLIHQSLSTLAGKRKNEIWTKSPFKNLKSPITLPDGNLILWPWNEDSFWLKELVKEIYEDRVYERFFHVEKNDIVVDVGANIGTFTLNAWKKTGKQGKVIAIEPENRNYERLCTNIRINKCNNVFPLNMAVSNFNGTADFHIKNVSLQHTLLSETTLSFPTHTIATTKVTVRTLAHVFQHLNISQIDFLKIDAEGSELEVLKGAEPLLKKRQIQKVSVAAYHSKTQAQEITNYLKKNGYNTHLFRNEGLAHFKLEHISARS